MDVSTIGNVGNRKDVADLNIRIFTCVYYITGLESGRSNDVALFASLVSEESNISGTVRIVLNTENGIGGFTCALEVDDSVLLSVSAAVMSHGNTTGVVSAGVLFKDGNKAFFGSLFGDFLERRSNHVSS